jgi:hypothetical protein
VRRANASISITGTSNQAPTDLAVQFLANVIKVAQQGQGMRCSSPISISAPRGQQVVPEEARLIALERLKRGKSEVLVTDPVVYELYPVYRTS